MKIRIENLRKQYDANTVALDNIDLTFEDGTFVALLGPSGCGKTTTLNCIAGLLEPTSGKVFFGDKDVTALPPKDRNIGMVFQSYALYPHLKVIDNIAFPLKQKGVGKQERWQKAREVAATLQIEHLLERRPTQLSGGQQQRVAMARALVKEPGVLLLDEPMSNLDARLKIEIRDEIKRIQQDLGVTAIIVTHDQEEAMAIADKIAILDKGRIQQFDTPERLYHSPANLFVAHFMGNPPMNFIDAEVSCKAGIALCGEDFQLPVAGLRASQLMSADGRRVKLGVRSHQMTVSMEKSPASVTMRLKIVENLGKELLLSGYVGESFVRATTAESGTACVQFKQIAKSDKPFVYLELSDNYNVFDAESGVNLTLAEEE